MTDKKKALGCGIEFPHFGGGYPDAMYNAAFNMTTDASLLSKAMEDYHQFIIHMNREE